MGREVKRVPADFDWPLNKVWHGFKMPEELRSTDCKYCEGSGYNAETRKISEEWYDHEGFGYCGEDVNNYPEKLIIKTLNKAGKTWTYKYGTAPDGTPAERPPWKIIGQSKTWQYNLTQDEVDALIDDGRLHSLTHVWKKGEGWQSRQDGYHPTAEEVNNWAQTGLGHDAINRMICIKVRAKRLGVYGLCEVCNGEGYYYNSPEHKYAAENWKSTDPPTGDAYQIWETVSEGSPVSPPFEDPEDLARWMVVNDDSITKDTNFHGWMKFILGDGWAPSLMTSVSGDVKSGVNAVTEMDNYKQGFNVRGEGDDGQL